MKESERGFESEEGSPRMTKGINERDGGYWEGDVAMLYGRSVCANGRGSPNCGGHVDGSYLQVIDIIETQHNKQASHKSQNLLKTQ